ncbi:hypothetical protein F5144DRAFT_588730 [Chaetomium tenue]|uniref:Uncharacterized protein n=1 Tax=Chaetomium tenue TaxID=1854479 RepID=A0ACB7PMU0_9PEZI|nr:hypothetical protein F5144DRAFT_588730 [Chaetomium globosum]
MNNDQFRRLLLANAAKSKSDKNGPSPTADRPSSNAPAALGSRLKSSIPMTPRSVAGARVDFAKQLAERNQGPEKSQKKFRSFAPKGSRFAEGYVDRSRTREEEEDERAERLKALEESLKKEEIDRETYDRLRSEIAGGDLSSTHLVKGLDFKLLERIRRGEDVYSEKEKSSQAEKEEGEEEEPQYQPGDDPDDFLEQLESTEVKAIEKEKAQKKGQFATTALNPGQKRSRNQILAEMKAARAAAAKAKEESSLGSKFKRIGEKKTPGTRIERDSRGREVMIIVDEDGHERRKVRKVDPKAEEELEKERELLASSKVLGMEVPEFYRKQLEAQQAEEDSKEINIFDDAGSDYDPLAGLEESDGSSDEEGEAKEEAEAKATADMPPPPKPNAPAARNYFKDSKTALTSEDKYKAPSLDDPTFVAALKKAKAASAMEKSEEEKKAAEREERLKKKLLESNRDDEDMDLGFGSSRVEDEADAEETKVKLSAWGGADDGEEGGGGGGGKSQRKRASSTTIPVYIGAAHALTRPPFRAPTTIHGETGLDGSELLPEPTVPALTSPPAIDAAYAALRACAPGTAWVVATGAFTNAAALFANDVFGITEGPPLHDPLAVAAVLTGVGDQHEIPFCECDPAGEPGLAQRERFEVTVVTEGTYEDADAGAKTGQITARLLPPGEEGVRIPRSLDVPLFWKVLEECVERADAANAAAAAASGLAN